MDSRINKALKVLGPVAAICCALAGPASADTFTFLTGDASSNAVNVSEDGGSNFIYAWAGLYQGQLSTPSGPKTVNLFCTDIGHDVNVGDTYQIDLSHHVTDAAGGTHVVNGNTYYDGGLASAFGAGDFNVQNYDPTKPSSATNISWSGRASEVAWLADQFQNRTTFSGLSGSSNTSMNMTAVNVAIWDIVQDGADGIHPGSGKVVLDAGAATNFSGLVSYYEKLAASHSTYTSSTAFFAQAPLTPGGHYQDFIYSTALPTPEAGSAMALTMLMLGGFFLTGRRRRSIAA